MESTIVRLTNASPVILQHTGNACLQLAGIKSGLLLTSVDSEPIAWLVIHSSYTMRNVVKKLLCMIATL